MDLGTKVKVSDDFIAYQAKMFINPVTIFKDVRQTFSSDQVDKISSPINFVGYRTGSVSAISSMSSCNGDKMWQTRCWRWKEMNQSNRMGLPIVFEPKIEGTLWFWVEYCNLNALAIWDCYYIPRVQECIDSLRDFTTYSTMDTSRSCQQVEVGTKIATRRHLHLNTDY